jgi:hypothetical protein
MDKKLVFVHIPKSAGASIVLWARQNKINYFVNAAHRSLSDFKKLYPTVDIYKSFAVTRNTYYRMLSLYNFAKNKHFNVLKQAEVGKRILLQDEISLIKKKIAAWNKGIVYYLDFTLNQNFEHHNQLRYIQDVDLILTHENLQADFIKVQELTKCYAPLTQRVHTYKEKTVIDMSSDYVSCIKRHFAEELDFFQYTV